ncbi:TetR/AcrR family transcriptional regulator [Kocuria coralli]|uniref:TetR/AcrR family transcriptional regulator n=1 Tax=Kocuria coralli TaxID=1461025 RepID=A0A5J5KVA6_9MICC|nr:TetR/AcrR family transcriptional regulator [Kocuria coralli]KAA9393160.1 TetR/AcrR family transcriptional regulator [Kocuria coralli]
MAKKDDLVQGALRVFARDGYTRARIVDIAEEAGVSTRTIYNLFTDKPGLFGAVVELVAREFVGRRLSTIHEQLGVDGPVEDVLVAFADRWLQQSSELSLYLALASRIQADRAEVPQEILDRGMQAGPERVQGAIALHLKRFMLAGQLRPSDPHVATLHLLQLIEGVPEVRGYYAASPLSGEELENIARDSVRAYLYGYAPPEA